MKSTKGNKGITIIALIITIVVLLILAGVTIDLVVGNDNLFDKARSTQKIQTVAGIKEALELEKVDIQVESKTVDLDNYLEQISTGKKNYDLSSKEKIDEKNAEIIINDEHKFLLKDKENGDVEIIYEGIAKASDLTISPRNETYTYPNSGTFEVTNNTSGGELTVSSDTPNIATASIKGNTITVQPGTTAGKANIIVRSAASGEYAENKAIHLATVENGTIELEAIPYEGVYDGQAHNAFTSISINPSDAKLEYSLDGNEYNEKMPTITNTSEFTVTVKASKEGYKTQITTETIRINKAEGKLTLSSTDGTYTYPTSGTFTVSGNTGALSVSSNNDNIAIVSINGNTVTVKPGTTAGKATITVTSAEANNYKEKTATHEARVQNGTIKINATPYTGTYDGKAHNAFTSVTTDPSDATIEYSIDGGSYSSTIPTIMNTSLFTVTIKASKAGYKTQTKTETVKVNKAEGKLTLSATSETITYPSNTTFTVSGNTGMLSVSSNNNNIATASVSGNTVTVKSGTTVGKATITVTSAEASNYTAKSATYTATVNNGTISLSATPYNGTYNGKAHNALTNVSANPSDAKLEYSINGGTYSTTMPTITNVSSFTVTVRASKAGYKTQSTTQTVKVNKANGNLTLSSYSGILTYPNSGTFSVSGNTGNLSVSSSNTNVVTVSLSGNTVTIIPKTREGSATITVKSAASANYTEKSVTYNVTVQLPHFTASSGVGYYADVDGNGTVDGVIFEDFKVGGSGSWGNRNGTYTIPTVSGTKEYYISKTNYSGPFGTKDVLSAKGSGNNRFYVMALSDVGNDTYSWSEGKGLESNGWIMPERNEWAAFLGNLKISESNYKSCGLKGEYWSSTKADDSFVWTAQFTAVENYNGYFVKTLYKYDYYRRSVRFCKKF